MEGRSDLQKYVNSAKTIENLTCFKHGGVTRRAGTRFVDETKDSSKKSRLIPFEFSTVQSYILEFGDLYIRIYRTGARVESPPGTPVEVVTPYLESEVFDLHFTQSADVLYLAHSSHPPQKLSRTSDTVWTLTPINFLDGPYLTEVTTSTITPSGTTGSVTLTASASIFQIGHIGSLWRLKHGTTWGYAKVTAFTNSTTVTATVVTAFGATTASVAYREGAWSDVRGYPGSVTLFQQRSWWAASTNNPDTIWASQSSDYENFDPGTAQADEALTFTLASNRVNAIRWMAPSRVLLSGTTGQEWRVSGGASTDPITPAAVNAQPETTNGSSLVSPVQLDNALIFLQRTGNRLRELTYDFYTDSYSAPDLTLYSEHITAGGITQMDYQHEKDSIVWSVRADGVLLGMTYEKPQDVIAWHRQVTVGRFESVAVIPNPTAEKDQVWVIVNRTINGATKRYVEYLDTETGYYGNLGVDCALSYSPAATVQITSVNVTQIHGPVTGGTEEVRRPTAFTNPVPALSPAAAGTDPGNAIDGDTSTFATVKAQTIGHLIQPFTTATEWNTWAAASGAYTSLILKVICNGTLSRIGNDGGSNEAYMQYSLDGGGSWLSFFDFFGTDPGSTPITGPFSATIPFATVLSNIRVRAFAEADGDLVKTVTATLNIYDIQTTGTIGGTSTDYNLATFYVPGHGLSPGDVFTASGITPSYFNGSLTVNTVLDADHFTVIFPADASPLSGTGGSLVGPGGSGPQSSLSGLNHLEGQMVDILGDGRVYPSQVVTGGAVTGLSPTVLRAEIGLHFDSTLVTPRPEGGSRAGTAQGALKRFNNVTARLVNSLGANVSGDQMRYPKNTDAIGQFVPETRDFRKTNLGWDRDGRITILQNQPLPLTVTAIIGELEVED
jgi:hypothetical protein